MFYHWHLIINHKLTRFSCNKNVEFWFRFLLNKPVILNRKDSNISYKKLLLLYMIT